MMLPSHSISSTAPLGGLFLLEDLSQVLLFIMHMACALGFALYFAMMKWAVLGASGVVVAAFYLFVWYQAI